MKVLNFLCLLCAMACSFNLSGQIIIKKDSPDVLLFHADSLFSELQFQDKRWTAFLKEKNVLSGLYHLKAGEEDMQKPHDTDEVYYIIEGKANFTADDQTSEVTKGSIIYVKADVPHRFTDITEELLVLVFFDQ